ncbi:MAG: T9SS type A sorting domain-containing protein [Bacteroidales bacterium]|nr:T9SS type A sorting domain-containing protein [Bacteroidales bacterium]
MNKTFTFLKPTTLTILTFIFINSYSQISETWFLDSLDFMEGHSITVFGDPLVVSTDSGPAIEFNGSPDQLKVDANPIGTAKEFTVEMVFKPVYTTEEPRVLHIGDPSGSGERVMMEIRISGDTAWYLDGFINTDAGGLTLIDANLIHPLDVWAHVAVTYKNDTFRTFVNGVQELKGYINYNSDILAETDITSIGSRMNSKNYFSGQISTIKVTQKALFISEEDTTSGGDDTTHVISLAYNETPDILMYPNPAHDALNIEFESIESTDVTFVLFDILGSQKMVIRESVIKGSNKITINVSHLNDGIYFLNQTNNPKPLMFRVVH